ncbi:hydrolase [Planotetraspora thailandica]|uniref:Hydrolase n=1 Tax=Planotetraspora thailandica TaxID=487172 RepID=A0A8J3XX75_9ACTN|nr:HAD family phosphatase [Planotetraspora thailandica]GII55551.1 hydrolase [Planotetraspora thailandica]
MSSEPKGPVGEISGELGAVLFDMDGTVVDTEGLWWAACFEVALHLGSALSASDQRTLLGLSIEDAAAHLVRLAEDPLDQDKVEAMVTRAFSVRVEAGVTVLPGALALLDALRAEGVPAALVSASPRQVVDLVLETVGADRFQLSIAADEGGRNKPAPDPYLTAAKKLGVAPENCVAIEDSPTGVASAQAAGCTVVLSGGAEAVPEGVARVTTLESVDVPLLRLLASRFQ